MHFERLFVALITPLNGIQRDAERGTPAMTDNRERNRETATSRGRESQRDRKRDRQKEREIA